MGSNFVINDRNSVYVRFTNGEKAPDFAFFQSCNPTFRLKELQGRPQTVEQSELGYQFNHARINPTVTQLRSRLGDITTNPQATDAYGVTLYFPDPIFNVVTAYGLELKSIVRLTDRLSIRSVFTWQESEGTVWKQFLAGVNGRDDDVDGDFSGKPSDNNPDFILNTTLSHRSKNFFANLGESTWENARAM